MIHVYLKNCEKFCTAVNIQWHLLDGRKQYFLNFKKFIFQVQPAWIHILWKTLLYNQKRVISYKNVQKNAFECCKLNSKHTINLNCTNKYTRQRVLKFGLDSYNVIIYAKWNKIKKPVIEVIVLRFFFLLDHNIFRASILNQVQQKISITLYRCPLFTNIT